MKKKYFYFYELKPFVKEYLIATNDAIGNNINSIDSSEILKDRKKKDDRNQESSFENGKKKSLKALENSTIIFDKEENTNILDLRLKTFISFG